MIGGRRSSARAVAALGLALAACLAGSRDGAGAPAIGSPPRHEAPLTVRIPEGTFTRGRTTSPRRDETPAHRVHVHAFAIEPTLVTRAAFLRFVTETGYVTDAERIGYGISSREGMEDWAWERISEASFRRPFRPEWPETEAFLRADAPVVMVSFDDANAYCTHYGMRLPSEAEWEYAMGAGATTTRFPWGDAPNPGGVYRLNFWQGASHEKNDREDGWLYVSPVRAFAPNAWGIYDPVGNVWQWTADYYAEDTYARDAARAADGAIDDPRGPSSGQKRVLRGGSWWCGQCTCEGYGLHYRGKAEPHAPFSNNGFRCAKSL